MVCASTHTCMSGLSPWTFASSALSRARSACSVARPRSGTAGHSALSPAAAAGSRSRVGLKLIRGWCAAPRSAGSPLAQRASSSARLCLAPRSSPWPAPPAVRGNPCPVRLSRSRMPISVSIMADLALAILDGRRRGDVAPAPPARRPCRARSPTCPAAAVRRCSGAKAARPPPPPRRGCARCGAAPALPTSPRIMMTRLRLGGLLHLHHLEAAGQGRVLLEVFLVLRPRRRGDRAQLAARQRGFEQVGRVALPGLSRRRRSSCAPRR